MTDRGLIYSQGATEPNALIAVTDDLGAVADLTGCTLTLRVGTIDDVLIFEKTSGLTYSAGTVAVNWDATGEIGDLDFGNYRVDLLADSGSEHRTFRGDLLIRSTIS